MPIASTKKTFETSIPSNRPIMMYFPAGEYKAVKMLPNTMGTSSFDPSYGGNGVKLNFKTPAPRFFLYSAYKFDIGIYMMPKHIFEAQSQDIGTFPHFEPSKD